MSERPLSAIVLAAGEGTRMRSERPKPLHDIGGRPMLVHVLESLAECQIDRAVVVVGHGAEQVTKMLQEQGPEGLFLDFVEQRVQRGTGDAVAVGLTALPSDDLDEGDVVVLPGDTPLLRPSTVASLVEEHRRADAAATLLTAVLEDPTGYGRVVRDADQHVRRVVEERDASADERAIPEVNTSIYAFRRSVLAPALRRLDPDNAQGEYYLTDVVEVLHDVGYPVVSVVAADPVETNGVNDRVQLAAAEAELRRRTTEHWMRMGVTMIDPGRTHLDVTVDLAADVTLLPGTILQGQCRIGPRCEIGPDSRLVDTVVGADTVVEHTSARDAQVGDRCHVGPFARLEPGSDLPSGFATGAFYTARTAEPHDE